MCQAWPTDLAFGVDSETCKTFLWVRKGPRYSWKPSGTSSACESPASIGTYLEQYKVLKADLGFAEAIRFATQVSKRRLTAMQNQLRDVETGRPNLASRSDALALINVMSVEPEAVGRICSGVSHLMRSLFW